MVDVGDVGGGIALKGERRVHHHAVVRLGWRIAEEVVSHHVQPRLPKRLAVDGEEFAALNLRFDPVRLDMRLDGFGVGSHTCARLKDAAPRAGGFDDDARRRREELRILVDIDELARLSDQRKGYGGIFFEEMSAFALVPVAAEADEDLVDFLVQRPLKLAFGKREAQAAKGACVEHVDGRMADGGGHPPACTEAFGIAPSLQS